MMNLKRNCTTCAYYSNIFMPDENHYEQHCQYTDEVNYTHIPENIVCQAYIGEELAYERKQFEAYLGITDDIDNFDLHPATAEEIADTLSNALPF